MIKKKKKTGLHLMMALINKSDNTHKKRKIEEDKERKDGN